MILLAFKNTIRYVSRALWECGFKRLIFLSSQQRPFGTGW